MSRKAQSRFGSVEPLEARRLMAADIMLASNFGLVADAAPDVAAKIAAVSDFGKSAQTDALVDKTPADKMSGDPDAGNPVAPNPLATKDVSGPALNDKLGEAMATAGDGDASDPMQSRSAPPVPQGQTTAGNSVAPAAAGLQELTSDYQARRGNRQSWAMDGDANDQDNDQCTDDQCHAADDKNENESSNTEQQKRKTVSPFGDPEEQQGHKPAEEKTDESGVGSVEDSPFFQRSEHVVDEGKDDNAGSQGEPFQGQQVGGPYFASTPVPDGVAVETGTAADAAKHIDNARAGLVDPSAQQNEARRQEALQWARSADMFFAMVGTRVDPLINPAPDDGEASPPAGDAPIPDNGFADPPKPSVGG